MKLRISKPSRNLQVWKGVPESLGVVGVPVLLLSRRALASSLCCKCMDFSTVGGNEWMKGMVIYLLHEHACQ